ncbi:ExeM/NucH family extracellular endonuclease [Arachnia propionica]|uniref:ExeM/NucH family extracellular endonuclease n=1 Tax=Arachnia propionica TaxID=1750 RepID=A0A3P1T8S6_9ACTN|nr:ExeM/NucH family extracellular endonuclease [Arachnia propionica]RRD05740.1 ExeM/NucH family extracellular endonuclease [Arachnia propionica]
MRRLRTLTVSACVLALTLGGLPGATGTAAAAPATDVMISVYLEGSGNNKAVELHNPTAAPIRLTGYGLNLFPNGAGTARRSLALDDHTIPAGGHLLVVNSQASAELRSRGGLESGVTAFNGDDALTLTRDGAVIDSVGQVGTDPGTSWEAGGVATKDMTLTRKGCTVDIDPSDAYDPSVEFTATTSDDLTTLGTVTCAAGSPPPSPTPTPPGGGVTPIAAVQGSGDESPMVGATVTVEGVVVGDFQGEGQFGGVYLQDAGDGDESTSDGIFVFGRAVGEVAAGDVLRVTGKVSEFKGQTQITPTTVTRPPSSDLTMPAPVALSLPLGDAERVEGMLVTFPDALTIVEYHNYDRFGEIVYAPERQWTPTGVVEPGDEARALAATNKAARLVVDDGRGVQNPSPAIHPDGKPLTADHVFRGGDRVSGLTGVMSWFNNSYKLQPTTGATFTVANPRPAVPAKQGDLRLASFNVLNYFTTLTSDNAAARGADTPEEFARQQAKIVAAMTEIDADVFGLMEIENNGTAVDNLVAALNDKAGADTFAAVHTGVVGGDAIFQAFIYKPAVVEPVGDVATLDFADGKNRHSLVQTFRHKSSGELVTVSVNHLKSKGSACNGDPDLGDGQGNCNLTRTSAAQRLAEWLRSDPTGQGAQATVIIGDLNSYDHEDPIRALTAAGFQDMEKKFSGEQAYSYVFDGMAGYLDHALANEAAAQRIVDTRSWHINADEADILDYDMSFKKPSEAALFTPSPFRSSDHDPIIVSLQLGSAPQPPAPAPSAKPEPAPSASPVPPPTRVSPARPTPPSPQPGLPSTGHRSQ